MIRGGADVITIEVKCTINAVSLNHPQIIPPPFHGKIYLPQNWSLVPKKVGGRWLLESVLLHLCVCFDFRAAPAESQAALTRSMTKDEVIEKLKSCIRQQDPAFRKRFLDFTKEPNGKINTRDFKKVGEQGFSVFLRFLLS